MIRSDFGMLVPRVIVGAAMAAHGAQKAFGWLGGHGPSKTTEFMKMLGFEDAEKMGVAAAYNEIASGLLVAGGFLGPLGPSLMLLNMLVAIETVHKKNGFFASDNGIEVPMLYASAALTFAGAGYGKCSFDTLLGLDDFFEHRPWYYIGLAGALGGAMWVLSQRNPAPPTQGGRQQPTGVEDEEARTPTAA